MSITTERSEYQKKVESLLKAANDRIHEFAAKAGEVKDEFKEEYNGKIEAFRRELDTTSGHVNSLRSSGENDWEALKETIDSSLKNLDDKVEEFATNQAKLF